MILSKPHFKTLRFPKVEKTRQVTILLCCFKTTVILCKVVLLFTDQIKSNNGHGNNNNEYLREGLGYDSGVTGLVTLSLRWMKLKRHQAECVHLMHFLIFKQLMDDEEDNDGRAIDGWWQGRSFVTQRKRQGYTCSIYLTATSLISKSDYVNSNLWFTTWKLHDLGQVFKPL